MYCVTKITGSIKLFLYNDNNGGYYFGISEGKHPAKFSSKKEAREKINFYFGYFKQDWQISKV